MSARQPISNSATSSLRQLLVRIAPYIVIASILIIVVATLFPFNFSREEGGSFRHLLSNFNYPSHLGDKIKNVFLFIPFGFSLTCLLETKKLNLIVKLLLVISLSFGLSFLVETLQILLPSRNTSPADLITNSCGGFVGLACFYIWKLRIVSRFLTFLEKNRRSLNLRSLILVFLGYIALSGLLTIPLQAANSLSNWDLNYPLILGNERTGDRPWKGYISEVGFADRAFSQAEIDKIFTYKNWWHSSNSILAHYQLQDRTIYSDRTGNLSDLTWQGQPPAANERGFAFNNRHWLQTATTANLLNQKLQETSQFTVFTTVATANLQQQGPARIISLSNSTGKRNFTIGQQDNGLSLRLRTPINGINAEYLHLVIPDIFADTQPHQIVIIYANSGLQVYVDNIQNRHYLNLLEVLPKDDRILYYSLLFVPLGTLLAVIIALAKQRLHCYLLLYSGILLPALTIEAILATSSGRSIEIENLLLGGLITAFTTLVFKLQLPFWLRGKILSYAADKI